MRQKFSTPKRLVAACAALLVLTAGSVHADDLALAPSPPDRYVVQKGDTLWGIAQKFLRDPWRWPEIWRINRDDIKNPHWIYPGDVVVFVRGRPGEGRPPQPAQPPQLVLERETVRVSPTVRATPISAEAIWSIPPGDIEPYLSRPLVTGPEGLFGAPEIVAGRGERVIRGEGDIMYAAGIDPKAGDLLHIYRPGGRLVSPDNPDVVLGYEQRYLGSVKVERFAEVSTVRIATAREEILIGDRLVPAPREQIVNYIPHAPDRTVAGRIIRLDGNAFEAGRGSLVTLDRGTNDGVDVGTVLAVYRVVPPVLDQRESTRAAAVLPLLQTFTLDIPPQRIGLLFVFRTFDYVSFAILLNITDAVVAGDHVRNP
jgi:hypothetical protein